MKKNIALIVCLAILLASVLPLAVACSDKREVASIEAVDTKTEYNVGDAIDYDALNVKINYTDGSSETKIVRALKATVTKADLSKAGKTSYTITYAGKSVTVNLTVVAVKVAIGTVETFSEPEFYLAYKSTIAQTEQSDATFKLLDAPYEVGNVNKFIYKPTITGFDANDVKIETDDVKTTFKLYAKDKANGTYAELTGQDLAAFVTAENNTYKFSDNALGRFVKLEVSLDESVYDISSALTARTLTCEFVVVNGYNAYDQLGLSVMDDHHVFAWKDLKNQQLEADDKKLSEYTNVTTVVLHGSFTINPDQLPAQYFWTENTNGFQTAKSVLAGSEEKLNMENLFLGSLNDGTGEGVGYYILDENGNEVENYTIQKGLFATTKCSLSGNYNTVKVSDSCEEGQRKLYTVVSRNSKSKNVKSLNCPDPHWAVFKFFKTSAQEAAQTEVNVGIKNIALLGNTGHGEQMDGPTGLLMADTYVDALTVENVNGYGFYTNIIADGTDEHQSVKAELHLVNSKFLNSFSNMVYAWKGHITLDNSEMRDAGGPLFLLVDGGKRVADMPDTNGATLESDSNSVLSGYATGTESWYSQYNAGSAVAQIKMLDMLLASSTGATLQYVKESDGTMRPLKASELQRIAKGESITTYINLTTLMIPKQENIFESDVPGGWEICGKTVTKGAGNENEFLMHNAVLEMFRPTTMPILQSGNNYAAVFMKGTDASTAMLNSTSQEAFANIATKGQTTPLTDAEKLAWATTHTSTLCLYIKLNSSAPYIGLVMNLGNLVQA